MNILNKNCRTFLSKWKQTKNNVASFLWRWAGCISASKEPPAKVVRQNTERKRSSQENDLGLKCWQRWGGFRKSLHWKSFDRGDIRLLVKLRARDSKIRRMPPPLPPYLFAKSFWSKSFSFLKIRYLNPAFFFFFWKCIFEKNII